MGHVWAKLEQRKELMTEILKAEKRVQEMDLW